MSGHPQDLTLREQVASIASGELDATELLEATLSRIEERNPALNAIVDVSGNEAAKMLSEAPDGPLHGAPVVVKDMYALPWRAPRDGAAETMSGVGAGESALYRRMRDAGAVVVGVTNMHELGLGSTGHLSAYGPVGNPWDPARCAGGSSGGSASAVGARMVAAAIGNDGGGSIRFPAAYCGISGIKLTWGNIPDDGYTFRKSYVGASGPFARDAADLRLMTGAMLGTSLHDRRTDGLRVGVPEFFWQDIAPDVDAACRRAIGVLEQAGLEVAPVDIGPATEHLRIASVLLLSLELDPDTDPAAAERVHPQLSPLLQGLVKFRTLIPAPAYVRAEWIRSALRKALAAAFADFDLLAFPTLPAPAPAIDNPTVEVPSGIHPADFVNVRQGGLANLTGVPAMSLPCGFNDGMPIGLQLVGPWGEEERLIDVAEAFERETAREFVDAVPPIAQQTTA